MGKDYRHPPKDDDFDDGRRAHKYPPRGRGKRHAGQMRGQKHPPDHWYGQLG